ncbi:MAG: acyl-CoA thioesterase [Muribaculaceae bacterium]
MDKYIFSIDIKVRDYEIDSEGIVNNANYLHYLEHTRHEFCDMAGFSFKRMQEAGIDPVLNRIEVDYKVPLRSGDVMESKLWVEMKGVRFIFHQDIFKKETGELSISAVVSCVCIENGKLTRGEMLADAFSQFLR